MEFSLILLDVFTDFDPIDPNSTFLTTPTIALAPSSVIEADPLKVLDEIFSSRALISFVITSKAPPQTELLDKIELLSCLVFMEAIRTICNERPNGWDTSNKEDSSALKESSISSIMNVLANSVQDYFDLTTSESRARDVETKSASGRSHLLVNGAFNCPTQLMNQLQRLVVPSILADLDKNLTARNLVIQFTLDNTGPVDVITMSCNTVTVVQQKISDRYKIHIESMTTDFQMLWDGTGVADLRSRIQRLARPDQPDAVDVDSIMTKLRPIVIQ